MNKKEILKKLQEKNKNFRLPSEMDFTIQDNVDNWDDRKRSY